MLARLIALLNAWTTQPDPVVEYVDVDCPHPANVWCTCAYEEYAGQYDVRPAA